MIYFPLLLAWRTLTTKQAGPIGRMVGICFLSIFIASFTLSLIVSVMHGFERETQKKLQGMHDDITIHAYGKELDYPLLKKTIYEEWSEKVATIHPRACRYGLIISEYDEEPQLVLITGIKPSPELIKKLAAYMKIAPSALQKLNTPRSFLIGKPLANMLGHSQDEAITLAIPDTQSISRNKIYFEKKMGMIKDIFQTGMEEFDMNVIFCSLDTFGLLFDHEVTHIGLTLAPEANQHEILQQLRLRFGPGLEINSWQELYPALLEAVALEKYAMFFILALVVLVASMSILALLFMLINQKRVEIALLMAHGIKNRSIQLAYLILGCGVALFASLIGTLLSFGIAKIMDTMQLITLPEIYGLSHLPAHMSLDIFIAVNTLVFLLSFASCWFATRHIASLSSADILRFEG